MSTFDQFFPSSGPSGNSGSFSGSFQGDGSGLTNIDTSSFALTASYLEGFIESSSYALTASYALNAGSGGLTSGSVVTGSTIIESTITSSTVVDTIITSSTVLDTTISSSTVLDTTITGSTIVDTTISSSTIVDTTISSSTLVEVVGSGSFSGSFVGDGSQLTNISTSSFALTASYAISSSHEIIHEVSSSYAETSSYSLTASYALKGGGGGATINPTNNVVPLRSDSTTFVDSIIQQPTTIGNTAFSSLPVSPFVPTTEAGTVASPGVLVDSTLSSYIQNGDVLLITTQGVPTAPNLALPGGGFIEPGQSATLRLVNAAGTIPAGDYEGRYFDYTRIDFNSATPSNGTMSWLPENQSLDWAGGIDNSVTLAFFAGGGLGNTIRVTGSLDVTSNITASSIEAASGFTGSLLGTSSYAITASYALNGSSTSITSSYALTASYLEGFVESASYATTASHTLNISNGGIIESGSTIIESTITGSTIVDSVISSSTLVEVVGSGSFSGSFVGDGSQLTNITASTAETASYITSSNVDGPHGFDSILSSSYALTASYLEGFIESSSYALTASYALNGSGNSLTSSYALTASYLEGFVESASYATTASHALTASYLDGFIESASYAEYAATSSIKYDSGSGVITGLDSIKINDFDDNVGVTFQDSKLTLTFGTPALPSISNFFNSGFLTDRFNQVSDSYNTIGNWDNGGYTFVEASILQGSTVLDTTTAAGSTNLTLPQTTAGSQSYTLIYTGSSPLDGSEYKLSRNLTSNLSKSNPGLPSISDTVTIQLGDASNQFEQGAVGSIDFSTNYGASNGWDQVSITNTPSSSPISVSGGGSTSISIQSVTAYQSPTGENSPQLSTSRTATRTFSRIRSVRYGASTAASFTQTDIEDLAAWDTGLGGTIGTIDKGNTNPSGDTITITWSGDKYQYIIYDGNRSDLTGISTSGFGVIGQFTKSTVGDYTVYRTNVLQAGGSGASITYNLT